MYTVSVYVCMYVNVYMGYIYIYKYLCVCVCACACVRACVCLCMCMFVHICKPKCMYQCVLWMCVHEYILILLCIFINISMYNGRCLSILIDNYTIFLMCMHLACMYSYLEKNTLFYPFWDIK